MVATCQQPVFRLFPPCFPFVFHLLPPGTTCLPLVTHLVPNIPEFSPTPIPSASHLPVVFFAESLTARNGFGFVQSFKLDLLTRNLGIKQRATANQSTPSLQFLKIDEWCHRTPKKSTNAANTCIEANPFAPEIGRRGI